MAERDTDTGPEKSGAPEKSGTPVDSGTHEDTDDVERVTRAVLAASRLLMAVSARSLAAVEDGVTLPQFRMLIVLSTRGATKLVALAELLQVAPSTAMRMVDRLITAGLAVREVNPESRRETLLTLTEEGRRTVAGVVARRRAAIASIVERLDPAHRAALVEALAAFNEAGGEPAVPVPEEGQAETLGWGEPGLARDL
ncbi:MULTISPECIES: MarR family winged helix-turn-helix transcriptional regulator [Streptomyces]|uniref:Transcriptional regulator, MarR family n=2 Tax=Streptomyces griseoaurantiacus TaxID=68213 RepID=A0A1G7Y4B1_9ACTN|nr:MarR family transcriptional regulator [Streptomyces jietaisiensis]SDG91292.1 transcriptional regulator, MarR family [Streptomyces jietaisiensis]